MLHLMGLAVLLLEYTVTGEQSHSWVWFGKTFKKLTFQRYQLPCRFEILNIHMAKPKHLNLRIGGDLC
jgi:hypothetical protein